MIAYLISSIIFTIVYIIFCHINGIRDLIFNSFLGALVGFILMPFLLSNFGYFESVFIVLSILEWILESFR